MRILSIAALALLAGCVMSSPVKHTGGISYRVDSRVYACPWCEAEAKSWKTAVAFCKTMGKTPIVTQGSGSGRDGHSVDDTTFFDCTPRKPAVP
jgi:hypothetical protein